MHAKLPMTQLFLMMLLIFSSFKPANSAELDPVKFLTDFYTWYIPAQGQMRAEYHRDIYDYVARETVEEIKKRPIMPGCDRTDYFLKLSDTPVDMKGVSIIVNQVEDIGPNTLVTFVTIVYLAEDGYRFPDGNIIVILEKKEGKLKIRKCIDIHPEG